MGIAERRERQRAELRETILRAARTIFLQEGPAALTMRRIAEAIEYSPGTIYLYFSSREEIALHLVREGFDKLVAAIEPAATAGDPLERLRAAGRAYVAFGLADPETYALIFMTDAKYVAAALTPQTTDAGDRAFDHLARAVADAAAGGLMRDLDPQLTAHSLWAALHGVVSLHVTCAEMLPEPRAVAEVVIDSMLAGLRA